MMVRLTIAHVMCGLMTCFSLPHLINAATKHDYYRLYAYLFEDGDFYKKNVRPAVNETYPIVVHVFFYLNSFIDIDEKEQTLVTSGTLEMNWEDNYLAWIPEDYGDIHSLLVPQNIIYLPDVIVYNSVRSTEQMGYPQQQVRLYNNGIILWEPMTLFVTSCDIDITYFPFDTQICYIIFATAVSTREEVLLKVTSGDVALRLDAFSPNGQWELKAYSVVSVPAKQNQGKVAIEFGLRLKRRRIFYMLNIVMPVFFLSLTSSIIFALPADEGEKMGTGITVLLAFAVYLTIVSDLVPNTSLQVSILAVYLTSLLGMCAISVVVCAFILRLHFRNEDSPVGPKTTRITHLLQQLICSKKHHQISINKVVPTTRESTKTNIKDDAKSQTTGNGDAPYSIGDVVLSDDNDAVVSLTWKEVAKTMDDVCFRFFTVLSIVITIICLAGLAIGGVINAPKLEGEIDVDTQL